MKTLPTQHLERRLLCIAARPPLSLATCLIVAFAASLLTVPVRAQVCSNGYTELTSQAEVNAFACSEVTGILIIGLLGGSDITDLTPLSSLTSVRGDYFLLLDLSVSSLAGLGNLTSIGGYLIIENNNALRSLAGLEGLTSIGGSLEIRTNNALGSLEGLENLTSIGESLIIQDNITLTSLEGLEHITSVGASLEIWSNNALTSLAGLENITAVDGDLAIEFNHAQMSLEGLQNITSVGGDLSLGGMISLEGLQNITSVGGLNIEENYLLRSLAGLEGLTSVGGDLEIRENDALTSLAGLEGLTSIGGDLEIRFNELVSLEGLQNLTAVGGDLIIWENFHLVYCSCGLAGLISGDPPAFTGVTGTVDIFNNVECISPQVVLDTPCETDETPPVCKIQALNQGPPVNLDVFVKDIESGISSIEVLKNKNATVEIPKGSGNVYDKGEMAIFSPPETASFLVNGEKNDQSKSATITIRVTDGFGNQTICDPVLTEVSAEVPEAFALDQNYPNPFNPSTTIPFHLVEPAQVTLVIYDILGRRVAVLVEEALSAGAYEAVWDGRNAEGVMVAGGMYLYRLRAGANEQTLVMTLLK